MRSRARSRAWPRWPGLAGRDSRKPHDRRVPARPRRSRPVRAELKNASCQPSSSGVIGHEQVFVQQPAEAEDGEDAQDRHSPCRPIGSKMCSLEPAVDPDVVPAPEVEDRASQDGIAKSVEDAVAGQGERRDQEVVGTSGQQVDLEHLQGTVEPEIAVGQAEDRPAAVRARPKTTPMIPIKTRRRRPAATLRAPGVGRIALQTKDRRIRTSSISSAGQNVSTNQTRTRSSSWRGGPASRLP